MSQDQIISALVGLVALFVGLWAIITRSIGVGADEFGETTSWVYGWRAVLIGCLAVLVACICFASAANLIHLG